MSDLLLSWSSGKDSAWTLHVLRTLPDVRVRGLFTTTDRGTGSVVGHHVAQDLVRAQARACALPVDFISLPQPCSNARYEESLKRYMKTARERGISRFAYGDLSLEDIRRYREGTMKGSGIAPVFPLFGADTAQLAREMVAAGLRAIVVAVDLARMPAEFAGREFNDELLADLPPGVDPCGESGEFHSFAIDGPMFRQAVPVVAGKRSERAGYATVELRAA